MNSNHFFFSDLDNLSHPVPALIKQQKFEEVENVSQRLLKDFPEQIDDLHRFAGFWKQKENAGRQLSTYYLKSAEFAAQVDLKQGKYQVSKKIERNA